MEDFELNNLSLGDSNDDEDEDLVESVNYPPLDDDIHHSKRKTCVAAIKKRAQEYRYMLSDILGGRFVVFLLFSQLLGKGILNRTISNIPLPLFKSFGVDAASLQIYTVLIFIPWSIKPLMGLASDLILIRGYNKRYWLVLSCLVGTASAAMCFLAFKSQIPLALVFCFCGINVQIAMYDLLSEGKYSEIRNTHPQIGSDATTLVQAMTITGGLIAMSFIGVLADANLFWIVFIIAIVLAVSPLIPTLLK